jgi:hypothetical protein
LVPAGHVVRFDDEHGPGAPVPLPAAPALVQPAPSARFVYRGAPPRVTFEWRAPGVNEFELQIARDSRFTDIVHEERSNGSPFMHSNLAAGRYWWRVTGLFGPFPGAPSTPGKFEVVNDRESPALTVEVPPGTITTPTLVLAGSTDPDCRIFIADAAVTVDREGRFRHELALRAGYNFLVVQAVDPAGNTAFFKHTILADLHGGAEVP